MTAYNKLMKYDPPTLVSFESCATFSSQTGIKPIYWWSVLVPEELLDEEPVSESDINGIIVKSKIAKSCPSCGCLIVVDDKQSKVQFL